MTSVSFVWPFLTIYISEQTQTNLTVTSLMFTLQALASILSINYTSTIMDVYGRKPMMVAGMAMNAILLWIMSITTSIHSWSVLMICYGIINPVFTVGANAMVADIIPKDLRPRAYAIFRISINLGISIGPLMGGWLMTYNSSQFTFIISGCVLLVLSLMLVIFIDETLSIKLKKIDEEINKIKIFSDKLFVKILIAYTLSLIGFIQMFFLLPIYLKRHFQILEDQSSILFSVNASIVILLQYWITKRCEKINPLILMIVGALIYSVSIYSVAFNEVFYMFVLSMVLLTLGELVINPTITTFVSNIAPDHMRARYMGMLDMVFRASLGIGPLIGGLANDLFYPQMIWNVSGFAAFLGAVCFLWIHLSKKNKMIN